MHPDRGLSVLDCRTHDQGEAQMQQIMEQGISTFISLQVGPLCCDITLTKLWVFTPNS